jgi:3-phosphoshikimate 1-carboxyvinyltransferase
MAMAFAPLALKQKTLNIEDPDVVKKSYPEFWDHLQIVNANLHTII